jgi:hypothetical protein
VDLDPDDFSRLLIVVSGDSDDVRARLADVLGSLEMAGEMRAGSDCGLPGCTIVRTVVDARNDLIVQFDPQNSQLRGDMTFNVLAALLAREFEDVRVDYELEVDGHALGADAIAVWGPGERAVLIHFSDDDDLYGTVAKWVGIRPAVQRVGDVTIMSLADTPDAEKGGPSFLLPEFAPDGRKQRALLIWKHREYAGVVDIRGAEIHDWHVWQPPATVISPASKYRVEAAAAFEAFVLAQLDVELDADFLDGWGGDPVVRRSVLRRETLDAGALLAALDLPQDAIDVAVQTLEHGPSPEARIYEPETVKQAFARMIANERQKPDFFGAFERAAYRLAWWWWLVTAVHMGAVMFLLSLDFPTWVRVLLWIYLIGEIGEVIVRVWLWTRRRLKARNALG